MTVKKEKKRMYFLRTKKLHIATLFLSVFIGGMAWMLVQPTLLHATIVPPFVYVPPTPPALGPGGDPTGVGTQPTYDPASYFAPGGAPGSAGSQPTAAEKAAGAKAGSLHEISQDDDEIPECAAALTLKRTFVLFRPA